MTEVLAAARAPQVGVTFTGLVHTDADAFDIDTRFRLAREAGVFDYIERTPPPAEIDACIGASEKYGIPIRTGSFYYRLGRDESLLEWHLRLCRYVGSEVLNVQIFTHHIDGHLLTDQEIVACYLRALEQGEALGIAPCLEIHVNMWSEHFGRVARVGEAIERQGARFNLTLDHSHVIFKIGNPTEQQVQGMRPDVEQGRVELDPRLPGSVCDLWIERNWVRHAHARSTIAAAPPNAWGHHADGRQGRGIQYPFIEPAPGTWHSQWREELLEPWKLVASRLLAHHARDPLSPLQYISTEFIPFPDYGGGAKYSMLENNIACARWLRESWKKLV